MSKETGGNAFPYSGVHKFQGMGGGIFVDDRGMSLRDYFAAKAMQGFIANKDRPTQFNPIDDAKYAYAIADAMLKARNQ